MIDIPAHYSTYPEGAEGGLYYVEFQRCAGEKDMHWRLFKRQFLYPKEEWEKLVNEATENDRAMLKLQGNEMHPWQLANGKVIQLKNVVAMETKEFLMFLVDSLNKNSQ